MKTNEISQDNYMLCSKNRIVQFFGLTENHNSFVLNYNGNTFYNKREDVSQILMNENWHNIFGVKKNGFGSFEYKLPNNNNFDLVIVFSDDYIYLRQPNDKHSYNDSLITIWNNDLKRRTIYVSEFQNLFKSLSSIDLVADLELLNKFNK